MLLLIDYLLGLVSPHICKGCGKIGSTYCSSCIFNTAKLNFHICVHCGKECKSNNLCSNCRKRDKLFDDIIAVSYRQGTIARLIGDYKYNSEIASCRPIAQILALRLKMINIPIDTVIIPIPTIPSHIRQRGFDHMLLVAKQLGGLLKVRVKTDILYRRDNISQHALNAYERQNKIKQSLALAKKYQQKNNLPHTVMLLDDIWTTGSTMSTAAKLLKDAGVKQIIAVTFLVQPKK